MIYMDNAATTRSKPPEVAREICTALSSQGNSGRGSGESALAAARKIFQTRLLLAELFGAKSPKRIAFCMNATEALNESIYGTLGAEDHVITTVTEHNSVLRPLYRLDCGIDFLPVDEEGIVDLSRLESGRKDNTRAVIVNHASNVTGNIADISAVGAFCRRHDLLCIVDASQTAGAVTIDVEKAGIDILAFTGHKSLFGPQGTGGIYVREGVRVSPLKVGGSGIDSYNKAHPSAMPEALEAGTQNGHGIAGLYGALTYLKRTGIERIRARESALVARFLEGIENIPNIAIYGSRNVEKKTAVVSVNVGDYTSSKVGEILESDYGIITRTGAHCAPLMHEALGTRDRGAVRFSFTHFNTEDEIDTAIRALSEIAGR